MGHLRFLRGTAFDAHRRASRVASFVVLSATWIAVLMTVPARGAETVATPVTLPFANVIVRALVDGRASDPVPDIPVFRQAVAALQRQAGDPGPIHVQAMRLQRFEQQARCGRVVFAMWQPSSNKAWPAIGGELNICEDGQPPLRVCKDGPGVLVPSASTCRDQSAPQDTPEVAAAIAAGRVRAKPPASTNARTPDNVTNPKDIHP